MDVYELAGEINWKIEDGTNTLILYCNKKTQKALQALKEEDGFHSNVTLYNLLDDVVSNGLCWTQPEDCGALTEAPMLCEHLHDDGSPGGRIWAFMDYQVRSVQEDLADKGEARWVWGGSGEPEEDETLRADLRTEQVKEYGGADEAAVDRIAKQYEGK